MTSRRITVSFVVVMMAFLVVGCHKDETMTAAPPPGPDAFAPPPNLHKNVPGRSTTQMGAPSGAPATQSAAAMPPGN